MPRREREHQMTLRLDDEEMDMREQLAERYGINSSGVMRQALRRWAREEHLAPRPPAKTKKPK